MEDFNLKRKGAPFSNALKVTIPPDCQKFMSLGFIVLNDTSYYPR